MISHVWVHLAEAGADPMLNCRLPTCDRFGHAARICTGCGLILCISHRKEFGCSAPYPAGV